ncbi:MAG: hypothetical protein U0L35_07360, partial [Methanobrevibacter sp.]|nr:hypothetical protein [Methanobrevibacter sp.]
MDKKFLDIIIKTIERQYAARQYNAILVILFFFNIQGPIKTSMIKANITLTSVIEYMMGTTISKKGFCN